ncbi:XdhC family protein [Halarcobacter sp.]|uniref:XdhC family protein n=1 Tax=Halarcobacter sp. TaxID=2321133 RepID=UPI0029F4F056|nr:XdhC family protein [Halarcobacter sp.]
MFENKEYSKFIEHCKKNNLDISMGLVTKTQGSTYTKAGNMMLVNSSYETIGVLGSKYLHEKVISFSKECFENKEIKTFENIPKDKNSGHGVLNMEIKPFFYDKDYEGLSSYIKKPYSLLIFGCAAHVTPLISMANLMGWNTTVIDIKIDKKFVYEADYLIELENLEDIYTLDLSSYDASVILSHNPKTDDKYLEALLNTNMQYIGLMGNKKNMQRKKEQFNLESDDRFFAPVGFDIGSYSSSSIALSICAQIEAKRNGKI